MAGSSAPMAFLLCALAMGAVVLCCAEASGRVATSGGCSGYADAAFGPLAGFITGVLVWVSAVLACGGIAAALADGLARWLPLLAGEGPRAALIIAVIGGIAAINIAGVAPAARLVTVLTVIKLVPLFIFVVGGGGWLLFNGHAEVTTLPATQFGTAVILALFAFSGMETPLSASGEVRDPARTIPKALILGMGMVTGLYIAIQFVTQGLLGDRLAGAPDPLAMAISVVSPALMIVLLLGASLSRFGWIGSHMLGAPRILFAFSRDGLLPRWLSAVNPRTHAPARAVTIHALIAIGLALTGSFETLAVLSGLATAGIYIMACASAWRLHRLGVNAANGAPRYAILPFAALLAVGAMIAITALGKPAEIIGLATLVAGSVAWFLVARRLGARA
jgi:basic amino acid/polyamine antiporter, APA family